MPDSYTITIKLAGRPDPGRYAAAVLGIRAALSALGLDGIATVWPDTGLVNEDELVRLAERWARRSRWGERVLGPVVPHPGGAVGRGDES